MLKSVPQLVRARLAFWLLLWLALAGVASAAEAARRQHPFLFHTPAEIEQLRRNARENPSLARQAQELLKDAQAIDPAKLPALERAWWDAAKTKSWREIYPEVNVHSRGVPSQWAGAALDCARASVLFPEAGLDAKARRIMMGLSGYTFEFDHFDTGMNYVTWGVDCLETYDLLYDGFAPEERARLDAFFKRMVEAVMRNDELWVRDEPGGELNNHYLWHKLGMLMYGLFYDQPQRVHDAIHGPKAFADCLRHGFTDDGLWLEASINYQFAATSPMVIMARLMDNVGADESLWNQKTDDGRTLRQSYDSLAGILFPDLTLPNIGDCYGRRSRPGASGDFKTLFARFQDPVHAWLIRHSSRGPADSLFTPLPELPEGQAPAGTASRLWPEHGYAMLRANPGADYWSGKGWTLFASYSHAPVHYHSDKLSLMLFGEGRHWLIDADARSRAFHSFSAPVQRNLNRQTVAHNTLLVDRASQRHPGGPLDLIEFQDLPTLDRLSIGDLDGRLYEGVRQLRTLIVTEDYVLDFFQADSDTPHEYAWLAHVDGVAGEGLLAGQAAAKAWQPAALGDKAPWSWLRGDGQAPPRQAALTTGTLYSETFTRPAAADESRSTSTRGRDGDRYRAVSSPLLPASSDRFRLDVLSDGPAEVVRCGFPRDDSERPRTQPMRMLRRAGVKSAWFLALYRLDERAAAPVRLSVEPGAMHRWELIVERDGKTARHLAPMLPGRR